MKKKLYRSTHNRMVAGVCGGLEDYLNIDATVVRVLWAVLSVISVGFGILAYVLCTIIIPKDDGIVTID